ncbi:hypothetical protein D049_0352B, partial [Vibrio parahaemolyticus VPTS-2010]
ETSGLHLVAQLSMWLQCNPLE